MGLNQSGATVDTSSAMPILIDINAYTTPTVEGQFNNAAVSAAYFGNGYRGNSSTIALNDQCSWDVVMRSGTWTFEMIFQKHSSSGIVSVLVDSVVVGTIDAYAAVSDFSARSTITGIVVATSGIHTIQLKMTAKNASASDYRLHFSQLRLRRSGN